MDRGAGGLGFLVRHPRPLEMVGAIKEHNVVQVVACIYAVVAFTAVEDLPLFTPFASANRFPKLRIFIAWMVELDRGGFL